MKTHDLVQGNPEWDQFRLDHRGASEAAAVLGISPKVKRTELLRMKHTGLAKVFSDWLQENVLDNGHRVEALARPIVENLIGEALYPVTCSEGLLSASCDGLTMDEETAWEHKQWNAALAEAVRNKQLPDEYQPQCQQILMITKAKRLIFTVSDGTEDNLLSMDVMPDPEWFERIQRGWDQFEKDLAEYVPQAAEIKPTGRAPETLPALLVEITGQVKTTNLPEFKAQAIAVFQAINRDLKTDEDFANADKTTKWCQGVEDRLKAAKEHALAQTASIDELFRAIDEISAEARRVRLDLGKLVDARKLEIKGEIVADGVNAFKAHVSALNDRLGRPYMPQIPADFGGAIKGMRSLDSMRDAVATTLANAKIAANEIADRLQKNLDYLRDNAADFKFLFADTATIIQKAPDDLQAMVQNRINQHRADEEKRLEAEREKIRKEEQDKLARTARAAQEAEDALVTSIWNNARRIEFDSSLYIQKAIGMFETGAKDWENDSRPRVVAAVAAARSEMKAKLVAAQEREQATAATQPAEQADPAVQPAATPAPAANVVPMRPAPIPVPAAPSTPPTLKLGQIGERLGFTLTADFLKSLGFEPAARDKSALLFHEATFTHICAALIDHIGQVQAKQAA